MAVSVRLRSRLRFGNLIQIDGFEFWDLLQLPTIPPQPDDILYQVKDTDRIDLLAFKFYGDSILWWVLAVANNLEFLPTDFNTVSVLRVPSQRYVQQVLFKNATFGSSGS